MMKASQKRVFAQLSKHQKTVAEILENRWGEISDNCPEKVGSMCSKSGSSCSPWRCPKLKNENNEGDVDERNPG